MSPLLKLIAAVACSVAFERGSGARPSIDGPELASVEGLKLNCWADKASVDAWNEAHPITSEHHFQQDSHDDRVRLQCSHDDLICLAAMQARQMRNEKELALRLVREQVNRSNKGRGVASYLRNRFR